MKDESIEIDGTTYLSSTAAARDMGYTKDYVGQLARAGKISAKLIGRSWYVSEDSIREHKGSVNYTLTKPKKRRTPTGPRETEKAKSNIDISDDTASVPVHKNIVQHDQHPVPNQVDRVVNRTDVLSENVDSKLDRAADRFAPLMVPIRKERRSPSADPLLSSHIEYEPGQPLYYDDERAVRTDLQRVVRFQQAPISPQPHMSTERAVNHRPKGIREGALSRRPLSRPTVPMDGVFSDVQRPLAVSNRPPRVSTTEHRTSSDPDLEESTSYTTSTIVRKKHRIPWLPIILSIIIIAGLAVIVWILFGI